MSWTASLTYEDGNLVASTSSNVNGTETNEQYEAALGAVDALINTGAVGHHKKFAVHLSGHGNENHEPAPGWANDSISISITQV